MDRPTKPPAAAESPSGFGRMVALGVAFASLLIGLFLGAFTWLLRDGLGPDILESSGGEALRRFIAGFWPIGAVCLTISAVALFVTRRRRAGTKAASR